ncbi:MAG: HDOD domain-containing protein [Planctomycetaceae bacterium]|nr:HDOD domain-containing protein [Planctomycetaceae bacterium]
MDNPPQLQDILDNLSDMPSLPNVVARLTRLIADPNTTASDINNALSADPGLVTKILKLVNSSYYGFSRRITTITNAVVILGFNQVRNLALSAFLFDAFARKGKSSFDVNGFWRHSIGVAFLAAQMARHINPKLEEDAFICGLLHDLGKFIMAQKAPDHVIMVAETVKERDILFYQAEKLCLGYDHAILGSFVLELWNLPQTLVDVVRCHHDPMKAPEASRTLCCVTRSADVIGRAMLMGNGGDRGVPRLTRAVWRQTGLDWNRLEDIMRKVAEEYSKSDAFFSGA